MRNELPVPRTLQLKPPPFHVTNFEGFVQIGPGVEIPAGVLPCSVVFDDAWELQFDVVEEGDQTAIDRVSFVRYKGQPSLGSTAILGALGIRSVEEWVEELLGHQVWRETRPGHAEPMTPLEGREVLRARRRTKIDNEFLARVAAVYRHAVDSGLSAPTQAVSEHFGVSRPQGARYVALARKAGELGQASPGRKGES
jgi:hypothetical protein